jgi:hypothetical protein
MKALFNTPYHVGIRNATDISEEDSRRQWRKYTKNKCRLPRQRGNDRVCRGGAALTKISGNYRSTISVQTRRELHADRKHTHTHKHRHETQNKTLRQSSAATFWKEITLLQFQNMVPRDKYTFNKSSNNRIQSTCGVVEGLFSSLRMTLHYECKQTHEIPLHSYEHSTFITKCNYIRESIYELFWSHNCKKKQNSPATRHGGAWGGKEV